MTPTQIGIWISLSVVVLAALVLIAGVVGRLIEAMDTGIDHAEEEERAQKCAEAFPGVDIDAVHRRYSASRTRRD